MNVSDLALQIDALATAMGAAVGELDISVAALETNATTTQTQLTAFNAGQAVQDTNISNLTTRQGTLSALTTATKDNLVNAINEVDAIAATALQSSEKGVAGGVAELDDNGKVPAAQLPSFVDDVVEVNNFAGLPPVGESGKIYATLDDGKIYRWGGSAYSEISASPGSTDAVAEGVTNLYFTAARAQAAVTSVSGNAGTATKLATARTLSVTGDATASGSFDGSANLSLALTLANSGVTAGSYGNNISVPTFSVDGKGRVTVASQITIRNATTALSGVTTLTDAVNSTSITTAATPNSVKTAYDLANNANSVANAAIPTAEKGTANGVATLDAGGKVPAAQLPSFVDDVIEGSTLAAFPGTGETGKIYVALDTGKTYRWSGSAYVEISASPGSTDAVTEGVTNLYFTVARAQAAVTAITGNAGTATKLQTARTLAVSGDATGSVSFDGSANATIAVTLANSGVTAGNYGDAITIPDITVDGKGRVTGVTTNTVRSATTAQTGVVQLSDSTSTTSSVLAATSTAVKAAYDLANTANTTANAAIPATQKGAANGVATLDSGGKVPSAQLPSFVDDVLEYANQAGFPATGSAGIIYVALDTNNVYRWSGTVYVEIAASPGSTDSVTEGAVNLYFTVARAQAAVTAISGNAGTATKLQTARTLSVSGDATGSATFDGSANAAIAVTLANTGVVAGNYGDAITIPDITVDGKGRVTGVTTNTVRSATTAQTGVVQLSDSTSTTSSVLAATSTAVKAAYDLASGANTVAAAAIPATQKGAVNGVATLDASGKVPAVQLPSFVDDVLEYANQAAFPATGTTGIIYVALDTNNVYRWSGSAYVEIAASPGSTDSVTEGVTNLYFTAARAQAAVTTITGNAGTATKLATARTIGTTGDAVGSGSFDGSANLSFALTLASTGVAAGTYPVVTVDAKGRVTGARALTVSDLPANVAEIDVNQTWSKAQRGAVTTVAYAATLALDLSLSNNFEVTLTGNTTLGLPTNISVGQSGMIKVTQDATGSRTMAFNTVFKFAGGTAPVLSTAANSVDELCYYVDSASRIVISALKDVK